MSSEARIIAVFVVLAALLPLGIRSDVILTILVFGYLLSISAVSFNLIFGFTGQLSMFHAAAFGIGAYATHIFMRDMGLSFWVASISAALFVILISIVIGTICFRFKLKAFYFAVVTLAFAEMARLVVVNWNSMTNGTLGINITEKPVLAALGYSVRLDTTIAWYYFALFALTFTLVVCQRIVDSWMGRSFAAIRLNDDLSDALGINGFRYKLAAFAIGNYLAAGAGALYAQFLGFMDPSFLSVDQSLAIVAMVLLGGKGRVFAPVIGAIFLTALPHLIKFNAEVRAIVYGLILIGVILFMPKGIVGTLTDLWRSRRAA